jgi:hypothetical protein
MQRRLCIRHLAFYIPYFVHVYIVHCAFCISMMLLLSSSLALGFMHGLGADHLMAIAALSVSDERVEARRSFGVAVRFAIGHAVLLTAGASAVVLLGWSIPSLVERAGEMIGGALLIVLGSAGIWLALTRRVYAHAHGHGTGARSHWHFHLGRRDRHPQSAPHGHIPGLLGAVFAVSGLRALTLMLPLDAHAMTVLLPAILLFAIGILTSMTLFGVVLSGVLGTSGVARIGRSAAAATGLASIGLGMYWLVA